MANLGVEALVFWELPQVELALDNLCQKWFFNDCKAYKKIYLDLTRPESDTEDNRVENINGDTGKSDTITPSDDNKPIIELGFVEKLLELWRLRKRIIEAKAEI